MASTVSSGGDCVFEGLSSRVLLRTGLQVVGVIAIVMGVAGLISVVGVVISEEMQPLVLRFGAILAPVFILAAGVYLTIGSKGLVEKLCPDSEEKPESGEALFVLAMKVLGAVLIVTALPILVQAISSFIYIKSYGPVWSQGQIAYVQGLSTLLKLIIGWYLLQDGKLLVDLAFRK